MTPKLKEKIKESLAIAVLRIIFKIDLSILLMIMYAILILLSFLVPKSFIAVAFDAGGGTIIHTRQAFNEDTIKRWGIEVHDEKEIVIILADVDIKTAIMQAVSEKCGIKTEAKGVILSVPVDSVIGIGER